MTNYYKAVRPDGSSFFDPKFKWIPKRGTIPAEGIEVKHQTSTQVRQTAASYLSASTAPTDCTGMEWPCRLLRIEHITGTPLPVVPSYIILPNKVASTSWRVVEELPANQVFGSNGEAVVEFLEYITKATSKELDVLLRYTPIPVDQLFRINQNHDAARQALPNYIWNISLPSNRPSIRSAAITLGTVIMFKDFLPAEVSRNYLSIWESIKAGVCPQCRMKDQHKLGCSEIWKDQL